MTSKNSKGSKNEAKNENVSSGNISSKNKNQDYTAGRSTINTNTTVNSNITDPTDITLSSGSGNYVSGDRFPSSSGHKFE